MNFGASTRYYLYRSLWFMLFMVSGFTMLFAISAALEGALTDPLLSYVLMGLVVSLGLGAAGMGREVVAEMEE